MHCWFIHDNKCELMPSPPLNRRYCDQTFSIRSEYLKHRKQDHANQVPMCKSVKDNMKTSEN